MALRVGAPPPSEYITWKLIFETGWTLDTVRSMSVRDMHQYLQISDGTAKASKR